MKAETPVSTRASPVGDNRTEETPPCWRESKEMMKQISIISTLLLVFIVAMPPQAARAEKFKSASQCTVGARVVDDNGYKGTITAVHDPICMVRIDKSGKEEARLFWMLNRAGDSPETNDKLVPGKYACYADGQYTFMDVYITGGNGTSGTYSSAGSSGSFRVQYPSRQIVFSGGSLQRYRAKLLAGPSIGLNSNGDSFYGTTCDLARTSKRAPAPNPATRTARPPVASTRSAAPARANGSARANNSLLPVTEPGSRTINPDGEAPRFKVGDKVQVNPFSTTGAAQITWYPAIVTKLIVLPSGELAGYIVQIRTPNGPGSTYHVPTNNNHIRIPH